MAEYEENLMWNRKAGHTMHVQTLRGDLERSVLRIARRENSNEVVAESFPRNRANANGAVAFEASLNTLYQAHCITITSPLLVRSRVANCRHAHGLLENCDIEALSLWRSVNIGCL